METRGKKRKYSGLNGGSDQKIKAECQPWSVSKVPRVTLDDGSGSSSNADPTLEDSKSGEAGHESKNLLLEKKILEIGLKMPRSWPRIKNVM